MLLLKSLCAVMVLSGCLYFEVRTFILRTQSILGSTWVAIDDVSQENEGIEKSDGNGKALNTNPTPKRACRELKN